MYKIINGWTKEKMIKAIMEGNKGTKSNMKYKLGSQEFDRCLYRSPDGNKCAAGCFIPDHLFHPRMDKNGPDNSIGGVLESYPELRAKMPLGLDGMRALQCMHDQTLSDQDPRPALIKLIETKCE